MDRINREHGGIQYPYQASELTDDEVGDPVDYLPQGTLDSYNLKDGKKVPLNLSKEHRKIWQNGSPEINRRWSSHNGTTPDQYQHEYNWSDREAGTMVRNARPGENGKLKIHPSFKEQTPDERLFDRYGESVGDPKANWRQIFYKDNENDERSKTVNHNLDWVTRAKENYKMKRSGMSNKEKGEYLKSKYPNRTRIDEAVHNAIRDVLNESKNDELLNNVVNAVLNNEELLEKAYCAFHPRLLMFPTGSPKQQMKWRVDEFINKTPEIFKSIMSISLRKKIALAVYDALCKKYDMH